MGALGHVPAGLPTLGRSGLAPTEIAGRTRRVADAAGPGCAPGPGRLPGMRRPAAWRLAPAFALALMLAGCNAVVGTTDSMIDTGPAVATANAAAGINPPAQDPEHSRIVATYGGLYDDPNAARAVARAVGRLVAASDDPSQSYRITILNSPVVNAFALPSGNLYVTRGLLALANDTSEVAAVVAHEMAHVTARHAVARARRQEAAQVVNRVVSNVSQESDARLALTATQMSLARFSQVQELEAQIVAWHRQSDLSRKLGQIPGIGPITACALVASLGDAKNFKDGRQVAAWLGLVPRQHSSGGKQNLLGISKRGDTYLRTLLIHGARSVIYHAQKKDQHQGQGSAQCGWLNGVLQRRNKNVAAVALANKNARVVWALLAHGRSYEAGYVRESV